MNNNIIIIIIIITIIIKIRSYYAHRSRVIVEHRCCERKGFEFWHLL